MVMTPEVLTLSNTPVLFTVAMVAKIAVAFVVMLLIVAYATYAERKSSAECRPGWDRR